MDKIHPAAGAVDLDVLLDFLGRALAPHVANALAALAPVAALSPAPLVDKREIGRLLGVSVATVDRLDREGQPHVRVGDAKRYDPADVLAWHRKRPAPASTPARAQEAERTGVKLLSRPRTAGARGRR